MQAAQSAPPAAHSVGQISNALVAESIIGLSTVVMKLLTIEMAHCAEFAELSELSELLLPLELLRAIAGVVSSRISRPATRVKITNFIAFMMT